MVDKELIENWRTMVKLPISSLLFKTNYEGMGEQDKEEFERDFDEILDLALIGLKYKAQLSQERTEKRTETHACDLISRQAAIDIERNATVNTNPSHFEAHQKFTQFMDDAEISSFGRWQWSNGFNTALTAVGIDLKNLPSAQPESEHTMEEFMYGQDMGNPEDGSL